MICLDSWSAPGVVSPRFLQEMAKLFRSKIGCTADAFWSSLCSGQTTAGLHFDHLRPSPQKVARLLATWHFGPRSLRSDVPNPASHTDTSRMHKAPKMHSTKKETISCVFHMMSRKTKKQMKNTPAMSKQLIAALASWKKRFLANPRDLDVPIFTKFKENVIQQSNLFHLSSWLDRVALYKFQQCFCMINCV